MFIGLEFENVVLETVLCEDHSEEYKVCRNLVRLSSQIP